MNSNVILWILGAIAVIAFIIVLIIQSIKKKLMSKVSKLPDPASLFSDSDAGKKLHTLVVALNDDAKNISSILEECKAVPQECVKELTRAFTGLPENAYNARWLIVYCATQFELPEFINMLSSIAKADIPAEKSKHVHLFSTTAEEAAIRLTAIYGIKNIAQKNNKEATADLFDLLSNKYLTLNIAACQGLLEINKEYKSKILEILPKEKQFIIDIVRKDVSEIPFVKKVNQEITTQRPKPQPGETNLQQFSRRANSSKRPKINQ